MQDLCFVVGWVKGMVNGPYLVWSWWVPKGEVVAMPSMNFFYPLIRTLNIGQKSTFKISNPNSN